MDSTPVLTQNTYKGPSSFFLSAFADSVLSIMASLVPFLKKEDLYGMPMGLAMTLSIWPQQTHNQVIKLLAGYVLPVLLGKCHLQRLRGR